MKTRVERIAVLTGVPRLLARRRTGQTLILAYHNVLPPGSTAIGERSLHVPYDDFARQLDVLVRDIAVVPLIDALNRPQDAEPTVAITLDDAYRGAVSVGVAELASRGLPATMFVAPGVLPDVGFWWDRIAGSMDAGAIDQPQRERALTDLAGEAERILSWFAKQGGTAASMPPECRSASLGELHHALTVHPGLELGAHSWSHPNLAAIPASRLRRELEEPLVWLRRNLPRVLPVLAYPYGRSNPRVAQAAREAGYIAALSISGGWGRTGRFEQFAVPRLNIPAGLTRDGFLLRLAGVRGRAA